MTLVYYTIPILTREKYSSGGLIKVVGYTIFQGVKKISTKQACDLLKIHKNTLYKWAKERKIKMKRIAPFNFRAFDYDEIKSLATKLPKQRGRSVTIYKEKDLRFKKPKR